MRSLRSLFCSTFGLALALPAAWLALQPADAAAADRRGFAAVATTLTIEKTAVGTLRSATGGSAVGTVVTQSLGPDGPVKKHIASVAYEELELELDLSLDRSMYDWISASWAGKAPRKSGTLTTLDLNGGAKGAREFQNALISETIFPVLDASSKEPAFITVLLAPERVSNVASSGGKPVGGATKGKAWQTPNFRLEIDGLDTKSVSRIEGLHFKQTMAGSTGPGRESGKQPTAIQLDNLHITLSEAGADSWRTWYEDFLVKGNANDKQERSGRLLLLGANLKDELARIELSNLGIVALRPRTSGSAVGVSQLEAELYVEQMALVVGSK
ncbi:MAG: hypothetical protein RL033_4717 [Pseudomonadota bacterium]